MDTQAYICSVIDKSFDFTNNYLPGLKHDRGMVPDEMIDRTKKMPQADAEYYVYWKPLAANITREDFELYEKKIGYSLPATYKQFLSYKYFIELNFGHACWFFKHNSNWIEDNYEKITKSSWKVAWENGLIPFGRDADMGWFCFDATKSVPNADYEIVTWDPTYEGQYYCKNFLTLVKELETTLDEWKQRKLSM